MIRDWLEDAGALAVQWNVLPVGVAVLWTGLVFAAGYRHATRRVDAKRADVWRRMQQAAGPYVLERVPGQRDGER